MGGGKVSYKSIIAIMIIIMITITLPVYCNIIDALVGLTSLIFLQTTLMKWFIKTSLTSHNLFEKYGNYRYNDLKKKKKTVFQWK